MTTEPTTPALDNNTKLTHAVYLLQALSIFVGFTAIIGVVINYIKRKDVKGTVLESHFTWQIKTFWYALIGGFIGAILTVILIGFLILFAVGIWYIYRIVKGWLKLKDGQPIGV